MNTDMILVIKKSGIVMEVPEKHKDDILVGMKVIYNDYIEHEIKDYVWVKYVDIIGGIL